MLLIMEVATQSIIKFNDFCNLLESLFGMELAMLGNIS